MGMQNLFKLSADITTANKTAMSELLASLIGINAILITERGFRIITTIAGESTEELNRWFLKSLKMIDPKATIRAEWTTEGKTKEFVNQSPKMSTDFR
jgi:hypothetical protein